MIKNCDHQCLNLVSTSPWAKLILFVEVYICCLGVIESFLVSFLLSCEPGGKYSGILRETAEWEWVMSQDVMGLYAEKGHKHRRDSVHVLLNVQATVQTQEG